MFKRNLKYEILSETGWKNFYGVQETKHKKYLDIEFSDSSNIKCSFDHLIMTIDGWKEASKLDKLDYIYTKNKTLTTVKKIIVIDSPVTFFDPLGVEGNNSYYSNNLISHNCVFYGSSNTLLSGPCLGSLAHVTPIHQSGDGLDVYEDPQEDHEYVMTVDVAAGNEMDYSAFSVIDISQYPYKVVAKYRNNELSTLVFPEVIYRVATKYNKAWVLIEQNQDGGQVSNDLHDDFDYENMIYVVPRGRKGQVATLEGFGKKVQLGVKTSAATKRIGCSMLKTLMEDHKLIVEDFDTVSEFSTFVSKRKSFEAEVGRHDDLVMTLVLFGWLTSQDIFNELLDTNVKEAALSERRQKQEELMTPMGFFDDGTADDDGEDDYVDEEGQFWKAVKPEEDFNAGGLFPF